MESVCRGKGTETGAVFGLACRTCVLFKVAVKCNVFHVLITTHGGIFGIISIVNLMLLY